MAPTLPTELVSRICALTTSNDTLHKFTLSSRQFYDIATPYLYNNLALRPKRPLCSGDKEPAGRFPFKDLTLLFLHKPQLAAYVTCFSISSSFDDALDITADRFPTLEEWKALDVPPQVQIAFCATLGVQTRGAEGVSPVYWNNEEAVLSLLLSRLKNLRQLKLEFKRYPRYVSSMLHRTTAQGPPFAVLPALPQLKNICLMQRGNNRGNGLEPVFFRLSSLRGLCQKGMTSGRHSSNSTFNITPGVLSDLPSSSSSIEHLEFLDCRWNDADIQDILRFPKALKTFIYEIGSVSHCGVSARVVREALETQKTSLESLWLAAPQTKMGLGLQHLTDIALLTSFQEFNKLKRLRLSTAFLIEPYQPLPDEGVLMHLLPPNIESVHLIDCQTYSFPLLAATLTHLLEHSGVLAHLLDITLEMPISCVEIHGADLTRILELAELQEIRIILLNNFGDRPYEKVERVERKWDEDIDWRELGSGRNAWHVYEIIDLKRHQQAEGRRAGVAESSLVPARL